MSCITRSLREITSHNVVPRRVLLQNVKWRSTAASTATEQSVTTDWENAKPYESIPGPKPLPIPYIGNVWRFFIGELAKHDLMGQHKIFSSKYGKIMRLTGIGNREFVFLFDPTYIEKMFRTETVWPFRKGLECLDYYREVHNKEVFDGNAGLLSEQNERWHEFRNKVNQPMMQPRNANSYSAPIDGIAREFVERMRRLRDDKMEMPKDFSNELNKWALESIAIIALDTRLGCLDENVAEETQLMIQSVHDMFELSYHLDVLPSPWTYISTPKFRQFIKTMDNITNISMKHVQAKMEKLQKQGKLDENRVPSILEIVLLKEKSPKIAVTMAMDMLLAGIDTTSTSVGKVFYYLSKNPRAQEILAEEVKRVLPDKNQPLTAELRNELKYLKACIKETQRLSPIILGTTRRAAKDLVIGEYRIPKGIDLVSGTACLCADEKQYIKASEFIPERWLKSSTGSDISAKNTHPFVFLPFGFGPRSCVGKRLAEVEMETLIARVVQNFKISYNYGDMIWHFKILSLFGKPLQFKMEERN